MIANDRRPDGQGTPDIVSFLVFDGTGPVAAGDLEVAATSN